MRTHPSQASRLRREIERLTDERDRARDEGKRADRLRQQLEAQLKVGPGVRACGASSPPATHGTPT